MLIAYCDYDLMIERMYHPENFLNFEDEDDLVDEDFVD